MVVGQINKKNSYELVEDKDWLTSQISFESPPKPQCHLWNVLVQSSKLGLVSLATILKYTHQTHENHQVFQISQRRGRWSIAQHQCGNLPPQDEKQNKPDRCLVGCSAVCNSWSLELQVHRTKLGIRWTCRWELHIWIFQRDCLCLML
jgi:hypothetical protein